MRMTDGNVSKQLSNGTEQVVKILCDALEDHTVIQPRMGSAKANGSGTGPISDLKGINKQESYPVTDV